MIDRDELLRHAEALLESARFQDYCPNGLQVEGRAEVARLAAAVTADLESIREAAAWGADALLVHHGYFWKGEEPRLTGSKRARVAALLGAEINLLAFHLPLDAHPELGNNAGLGRALGLIEDGRWPAGGVEGWLGRLEPPLSPAAFGERIAEALGRPPQHVAGGRREVRRVAWCTGAAQDALAAAVATGADAFVTGEIAERTWYLARESGIEFYAAGHHATERFGVQALGASLARRFGLEFRFFDRANPV